MIDKDKEYVGECKSWISKVTISMKLNSRGNKGNAPVNVAIRRMQKLIDILEKEMGGLDDE